MRRLIASFKVVWRESEEKVAVRFGRDGMRERGEFGVSSVIGVIISIVVLGTVVGALWSTLAATDTTIQALTETDAGTVTLQAMWPMVLVIVGIGIAAGAVVWILHKMDVM